MMTIVAVIGLVVLPLLASLKKGRGGYATITNDEIRDVLTLIK
jgi:hypothetical protein